MCRDRFVLTKHPESQSDSDQNSFGIPAMLRSNMDHMLNHEFQVLQTWEDVKKGMF